MGCCLEREQPRMDVPLKGATHAFKIVGESMFSNNFTVYDNTPNDENPNAPWLRLVHSCNLDNDPGTISVEKKAKSDGDKPLLKVEVGPIEFKEIDSSTTDKYPWFDWGQDDKSKLAWEAERTVKVLADGEVEKPAAVVSIKYKGVACCTKKDRDYDRDGDREVTWEKWATTKEVNITVEIEGKKVSLEHNLGEEKGSNGSYDQKYKVEGHFNMQYVSKWGKDEVLIRCEEGGEPLSACAVGFVIAYWLHPKRVEDNAMSKAEKILRDQQGWFD